MDVFILEPYHLQFIPDYLKGYIIRSLSMLKPFDDYDVDGDVKNMHQWIKFKNEYIKQESNRINKIKDGMIYYKAF
jgi:hypothetical protein